MFKLVKKSGKVWHIKDNVIEETLCGISTATGKWTTRNTSKVYSNTCSICLNSLEAEVTPAKAFRTNEHESW